MGYDNLNTEELLQMIAESEAIDPNKNPEVIADYQNGTIVQKILDILNAKEITQNELAKRIGKSKQYVSKILHEKRNFTINSLAMFSSALECDLKIDLVQREKATKKNDEQCRILGFYFKQFST